MYKFKSGSCHFNPGFEISKSSASFPKHFSKDDLDISQNPGFGKTVGETVVTNNFCQVEKSEFKTELFCICEQIQKS